MRGGRTGRGSPALPGGRNYGKCFSSFRTSTNALIIVVSIELVMFIVVYLSLNPLITFLHLSVPEMSLVASDMIAVLR